MSDEIEDQETVTHEEDEQSAGEKAKESAEEREKGAEKVKALEDDPPTDLNEWPDDAGKYTTFGGGEGDHGYDEGPESNLGESEVRHHEDGSVSVSGEKVDDPDEYKGEPIPGGPTDPNSPDAKEDVKDSSSGDEDDDED